MAQPADHPLASRFTVRHPEWAANATIYEVNVRNYTPEGTFRAFEAHLPRLAKMGVVILWLMPIHPIGEAGRKGSLGSPYAVRDYFGVNPEFGSLADLRHLVDAAHALGMKVLLDWVANHTSRDNALVTEHPAWYRHDAQGQLVPPVADWTDVVALDYTNRELRAYMTDALAYWVREADVDGYRCDVAGLVPTDFWDEVRPKLEALKPVFMLAEWDELYPSGGLSWEEFNSDTELLERAFDMTFGLRLHYLLDGIAEGHAALADIDTYLAAEREKYPPTVYLMNFTSNHDVNSWDGTEYERLGPLALPFAMLAALLPGLPMLYSGQEAGLNRRLDFFERDTIKWDELPLENFYTKLLQLKKRHPALRNGDPASNFQRLNGPAGLYGFVREKGGSAVVVLLNATAEPLELPGQATLVSPQKGLFDVFSGEQLTLAQRRARVVPAHGYRVLRTRD